MTMKKRMESRRAWKRPGQEEVESCLDALYTDGNISRRMEQYYREKRKLLIRVLLAGMFLSVAAWAVSVGNLELTDGFFLPRRNEAYEKDMEFQADEGKNEKVKILVEPKRLSRKESRALLDELQQKMETLILGENESLEEVRSDLHLLSEIEGTPVTVVWELDSYEVLNLDGSIRPEHLTEEGAIVELTAHLTCHEETAIYRAYVKVLPPIPDAEERFMQVLEEELKKYAEKSAENDRMRLPQEVQGKHLTWTETRESSVSAIFLLTLLCLLLLYVAKDRELKQKVQERQMQMCRDYAQIVSKLVLLMQAGLTVRNAWEQMVWDYRKKCERDPDKIRYAYEEMMLTSREMRNGVAEVKAYENFGLRCRVPCYLKLAALLEQNLKKGNKGLTELLQMEVREAFEQRRELARSRGEEASTKLLVPMILMLFVIMLLILVPAGLSMQV